MKTKNTFYIIEGKITFSSYILKKKMFLIENS